MRYSACFSCSGIEEAVIPPVEYINIRLRCFATGRMQHDAE